MKEKSSLLGKLLKLILIAGLIVGIYYGGQYILNNFDTSDQENETNQITNNEESSISQSTKPGEDKNESIEVSVVTILENPLERINFRKIGTVSPYKSITLTAETSGILKNVQYSEGEKVEKGSIIAQISDSTTTEIAQINYEASEKNLELAKESLEGTIDSINNDILIASTSVETAQENYNKAHNSYKNLEDSINEQMKSAKLAIQTAETGLQSAQRSYYDAQILYQEATSTDLNAQLQVEAAFTQLQQAEIQLASARQSLENAEKNKKSQLDSANSGIKLAELQLETAEKQLENVKAKGSLQKINAEKQVVAMETQTNTSRASLMSRNLYSAMNGVLLSLYSEEGNFINPSQKIAEIADMNKIKVITSLTTKELAFVKLGQKVSVKAPGNIKEKGIITKVLPTVDPISKKVEVEIVIDNKKEQFKSGMFVDVYFPQAQKETPSIYVPFKSIKFENEEAFVYVAKSNKASKRKVSLGQLAGNSVEITDGIKTQDKVITDGAKLVKDDDLIKIVSESE